MSTLRRWLVDRTRDARTSLERARVFRSVAARSGLAAGLRAGGLRALIEARGKTSPSMLLRYHAANTPHRTALVFRDRSWSFLELNRMVDRVSAALAGIGIGAGDAVALMLHNCPEFLFLQSACARRGAAAVSVSWRSTPAELRYLLANSHARAVFFDAGAADAVKRVLPGEAAERAFSVGGSAAGFRSFDELVGGVEAVSGEPDSSDDGAVVIYTSGTTGKPKGAVRRFGKDAALQVLGFIGETPLRVGQTHLAVCPLYHSTAFGFITVAHILGSTVVLLESFEPRAFLEALERYRIDHTAVVPTMLHRTLALGADEVRRRDLSNLAAIFTGGAPLSPTLAREVMNAYGEVLYNFYGATETGFVTLAKPADLREAPGTIGRPIVGNEILLLDDAGNEVAPGEVGELYVRSGNLVAGYHDDERATNEAMQNGFFSVGDLARRDEHGRYFLEGRKRDMIISGGVNVYPREVETVLAAHPDVAEAAIVGIPDDEWGERVHAFVTLRPGARSCVEALLEHCRVELAGPKRPREITIVEELPRNATGKVLKRLLRDLA